MKRNHSDLDPLGDFEEGFEPIPRRLFNLDPETDFFTIYANQQNQYNQLSYCNVPRRPILEYFDNEYEIPAPLESNRIGEPVPQMRGRMNMEIEFDDDIQAMDPPFKVEPELKDYLDDFSLKKMLMSETYLDDLTAATTK
jgi:hypothetical protein